MAENETKQSVLHQEDGDKELLKKDENSLNIKHDWYQTETHVTITILAKSVKPENVSVNFNEHSLDVIARLNEESTYSLHLDLAHAVLPPQCSFKVLSSKIEIKLKKAEGTRWVVLEGEPKTVEPKGRNWDKVVGEIEDDKAEGEAALNALFQKIYSEGSDEVKKAMNKSFLESGGTVLSTNWSEVAKDKVDIKPPDGMEWRKWDQ
ncbi:suppressor of G2 allele of skp1 [Lycorma delicatula]|uniref:suppressor of G2 allele of skp1 n=1 Tax=Lycorma delicatula TaxID=130591 RepID=UPI003F5140B3